MSRVKLNIISAVCENMGIGVNGTLPWRLKNEMAYFTSVTSSVQDISKKNAVIMGRVTWDCIPPKYKPLANRMNIVITEKVLKVKNEVPDGVEVFISLDEAIKFLEKRTDVEKIWVIGGSQIYKIALEHPNCDRLYLTEIQKSYDCDTFFPDFDRNTFQLDKDSDITSNLQIEDGVEYYIRIYKKCH